MAASATRVALGFRPHTGWAAMVATAGPAATPSVLARAHVEMIAGHDPDAPPFVYHAAAKLPLPAAERLVRESTQAARARAEEAIAAAVAALRERGCRVVAAGVIVGNRPARALGLAAILAAHPLLHAAEGELFRGAIADACAACDVPVVRVPAGELYARGEKAIRAPAARLRECLTAAGRDAGKPWAQDQKESLLVALLALAGAG